MPEGQNTLSLGDYVPLEPTVTIEGKELVLRGLSLKMIGNAIQESGETLSLAALRSVNTLTQAAVIFPETISRLCVKSIRQAPPEIADSLLGWIEDLPLEPYLQLIEHIVAISFPGGIGPFGDRLARLAGFESLSALLGLTGRA